MRRLSRTSNISSQETEQDRRTGKAKELDSRERQTSAWYICLTAMRQRFHELTPVNLSPEISDWYEYLDGNLCRSS